MVAMEFYPRGDAITQLRAAREMALRAGHEVFGKKKLPALTCIGERLCELGENS
jgi:hypothetical protein